MYDLNCPFTNKFLPCVNISSVTNLSETVIGIISAFPLNLAISKLNGVIIENGAEFSFNNTIGPMNEGNGFKKATGFDSNGKKIKISGGGICQISSTLYNCALIAGFDITERHPHSRRVYYVPKDKDATILYGSLDLKFVNNSGSKVRIDASATKSTVTITLVKIK